MEERQKRYTMTLADGTRLEKLHLNGNNYISRTELTTADFAGKLETVTVDDGENVVETLHDAELVQIIKDGDEWWFVLRELSEEEKRQKEISDMLLDQKSQIDYIAMETGIDL